MDKQDKIYKLIEEINNVEVCNLYFDWTNYLIEHLNLSRDDVRLSLNVRYDSVKRFSTNVNHRLVLGLRTHEIVQRSKNLEEKK